MSSTARDEGYIKFSITRIEGDPPVWDSRLQALNEARTRLFDMGLIGVLPDGIGFGNVSIRKNGEFIISGSATGAARVLSPEQYSTVIEADISVSSVTCRGKINASSESLSHAALYNALPEVMCVIHIHNTAVFEYMIHNSFTETPVNAAYGTPEIALAAGKAAADTGPSGSLVMRGHQDGALFWGKTVESVMDRIENCYTAARSV